MGYTIPKSIDLKCFFGFCDLPSYHSVSWVLLVNNPIFMKKLGEHELLEVIQIVSGGA